MSFPIRKRERKEVGDSFNCEKEKKRKEIMTLWFGPFLSTSIQFSAVKLEDLSACPSGRRADRQADRQVKGKKGKEDDDWSSTNQRETCGVMYSFVTTSTLIPDENHMHASYSIVLTKSW